MSPVRWTARTCPDCGGEPVAASEPRAHGRMGVAQARCAQGHRWQLSWRSEVSTTARLVRYLHAAGVCGAIAERMERQGRGGTWEAQTLARAVRRLPVLAREVRP